MDFKGKKVLVIGMARSGAAAASLLLSMGAVPMLNDNKNIEQLDAQDSIRALLRKGALDCLGAPAVRFVDEADMLVISPGVPAESAAPALAKEQGKPVLGEIETAYLCTPESAEIVAITGTNGKTTTTALTGEIFRRAGRRTHVVGNIGIPYTSEALSGIAEGDSIIAEISSYQLETVHTFRPSSAAFLNLTEDHLLRHHTMENYGKTKMRITENQTAEDFSVFNADDAAVMRLSESAPSNKLYFSRKKAVHGAYCIDGNVYYELDGEKRFLIKASEIMIPGPHNLENAMAAALLALSRGISPDVIAEELRVFPGVEHRIEYCGTLDGVRYINDSKGTNPDSTIKAVQSMEAPTILILGGSEKNSDYLPMFEAFTPMIKACVVLGETAPRILADAEKAGYKAVYHHEGGFEGAVEKARDMAGPGYNVLLSPACASFDMFRDYEERGRVFKDIVSGWGAKK